jgi:chromosome partitioning protein
VIVVVANLKGGVGKTTTAVLLAEAAAERSGRALLVDADPQGSAMRWADAAADDGGPGLRAVAVALPTTDLGRRLGGIASGYVHVVIDTPPGQLGIVQAGVRASEVVLVPVQPNLMDLDRIQATLDVAAEAGRPAALLLTRVRANTRSLAAALAVLEEADLPVLSVTVPQREVIATAYGTRPGGVPLDVYTAVFDELEAALT